jgi:hypothetical protein
MARRVLHVSVILAALAVAASCSKSNPAQPSETTAPAAAGEALTASIIAPRPLTPNNTAQIPNLAQPVILVVQNAISTKSGATYTFEVATDSAFASKVQTKDAVPEGSGQTGVRLDALAAARDYYWHARATAGGTTGVFGIVYKFTIGAAISLSAPVPVSPLTGTVATDRPGFIVTDAVKTGPAGTITYRFEVADNTGFSPVLVTGTVAETAGQTTFTPASALPIGKTLYWRATALDQANAISSSASAVQSFTCTPSTAASLIAAQEGLVLWPGVQPPGSAGHAFMGPGWNIQVTRDFTGVVFLSPTLEVLRVFDLLDRGFDPQGALNWMNSNGYLTAALYYPSVLSIGFQANYLALIAGQWELVLRVGA